MNERRESRDWRPDWKDEGSYPQDSDPYLRFAWEFLRRSGDYQEAFATCHRFKGSIFGDLSVISQPYVRTEKQSDFFRILDRFQMQFLVDPTLNFDYAEVHLSFGSFDSNQKFRGLSGIPYLDYAFVQRYSTAIVPLVPEQPQDILFRFDLSRDIPSQLKEAKEILLEKQKDYQSPKESDKPRLRRLLRILDAKAVAVTHSLIGLELYKEPKRTVKKQSQTETPRSVVKKQSISRDVRDAREFARNRYLDLARLG